MSSTTIYDSISESLGLQAIDTIIDNDDTHEMILNPTLNREEAKKRNAEIVTCGVCGVSGNYPNMMRWHFENCSQQLRNCQQCGEVIPRQGTKPYLYKQKKFCNRKCYAESKKGKPPIVMTEEVKQKLRGPRKK